MDRAVFERIDVLEDHHWWSTGRRAIFATLIEPLLMGKEDPSILEAGCGSGGNLRMLWAFGNVEAFEFDEVARSSAIRKSGMDIPFGALPSGGTFREGSRCLKKPEQVRRKTGGVWHYALPWPF